MNDNEIWVSLVQEHYPTLNKVQLIELKKEAACSWWLDSKDEKLSVLFDQYVMMKNLRG